MPDYKELGKDILKAARSYPVDETPFNYGDVLVTDEFLNEAGWKPESGAKELRLPSKLG